MNLILIGINHKTASLDIREKLAFNEFHLNEAYKKINSIKGISGSVIISTCNRVEICCSIENLDENILIEFISDFHKIEKKDFIDFIYIYKNKDVFIHLSKVAAGLDSLVIGETQVFGQVKKAYQYSLENGYTSKALNIMFQKINKIVKTARTETNISVGAVSISYAAVELAKKIFSSLNNIKVMLIGAGKMAELCALYLARGGSSEIIIANRSKKRSTKLAEKFNGKITDYNDMFELMKDVDIVIVSTSVPEYIIRPEHIDILMKKRDNNILFFVDISVPRNIDPDINNIDNVFLYNIDDLKNVSEINKKKRKNDIELVENIIQNYVIKNYSNIFKF